MALSSEEGATVGNPWPERQALIARRSSAAQAKRADCPEPSFETLHLRRKPTDA